MRNGFGRAVATAAIALVAIALSGVFTPSRASGELLVVMVPESFEIGERVFPASQISIRHLGAFNPVKAMLRVHVGDECLGVLLVRSTEDRTDLEADSVVFDRTASGRLSLAGLTIRGPRSQDFYAFEKAPSNPGRAAGAAILIADR